MRSNISFLMMMFVSSNAFSPSISSFFYNPKELRQVSSRPDVKKVSSEKRRYIIDIDGTICTKTNSDYCMSEPIYENIDAFNKLFEYGHEVHYWTSRGALSGKNWDVLTVKQLNSWNVKYHTINMGKPHYDVWIDDKAINSRVFCDREEDPNTFEGINY